MLNPRQVSNTKIEATSAVMEYIYMHTMFCSVRVADDFKAIQWLKHFCFHFENLFVGIIRMFEELCKNNSSESFKSVLQGALFLTVFGRQYCKVAASAQEIVWNFSCF